jgi:tetratricopeptide (TPR) repeat protein
MLGILENESGTAKRRFATPFLWLAVLAFTAAWPAFSQSASPKTTETSSVEGIVRDAGGEPVPCARVLLVERSDAKSVETKPVETKSIETKSTAAGMFSFSGLHAGDFTVAAQRVGLPATTSRSIELSTGEKKHLDLVLDSPSPANVAADHPAPHDCYGDSMQFSDQPNFVIAGITDWSNLGLHGSDATARTSEALAKETLALKSHARESPTNSSTGVAVVHRQSGDRYERSNDPVAAVREYEQAAQLDPSEENYLAWGSELLLHRAAQPAAEVFAKGFALHPKSARMLAGLGAAMYADGLRDEAARRLCQASDLDPADFAPYLFLGKMQETAIEPLPCAEEKLERFAGEQPENALANYYYAISLWKGKRPSGSSVESRRAEALLNKAAAIDPALGESYLALGSLYSAQSDFARAQEVLRKAIGINPNLGEAHRLLGQAYKRTGQEAEAEREFAIFKQCQKTASDALERERREQRQFLVILKDQPTATSPR